jgi:type IV secretion system protein TrbL
LPPTAEPCLKHRARNISRYIDSGFGLLSGDVAFLTTVLVAIDITLAGLFWALMGEDNVPAQLIRKVLYVGFFALLIGNFKSLADIVFQSFAGLGLKASGTALTASDLMRPGFVASAGYAAARPLLEKAGELIGITTFFSNFMTIAVLLLGWLIVLLAFFVLSVQLFITIIEFKLTVLAGFVLVPFALFGQTAFLAERVLGNVISSGIKLMVLAIVVGIGASIFGTLVRPTSEITLAQAASTILAAIAVFGLALFIPGLAAGLVSGAPQLGAGSAVATTAALGGTASRRSCCGSAAPAPPCPTSPRSTRRAERGRSGPRWRPIARATPRSPFTSPASSTTCARCRAIRWSCARTGSRPMTSSPTRRPSPSTSTRATTIPSQGSAARPSPSR